MPVTIYELIYDPIKGRDVTHPMSVNFEPLKYQTSEQAAKALHEALIKFAHEKYGMSVPEAMNEIHCWPPERTKQYSGCEQWCVVWESGPFEWAIALSMEMAGPWGYCEPYYSFDLHFTN